MTEEKTYPAYITPDNIFQQALPDWLDQMLDEIDQERLDALETQQEIVETGETQEQ